MLREKRAGTNKLIEFRLFILLRVLQLYVLFGSCTPTGVGELMVSLCPLERSELDGPGSRSGGTDQNEESHEGKLIPADRK